MVETEAVLLNLANGDLLLSVASEGDVWLNVAVAEVLLVVAVSDWLQRLVVRYYWFCGQELLFHGQSVLSCTPCPSRGR